MIDKTVEFWIGDSPEDIREFLEEFVEYPIDEFRLSRCVCGSIEFGLRADPVQAAQRTCAQCGAKHFIADSADYWEEEHADKWICPCPSFIANIGAGFSLYQDKQDIRWIYIGVRCVRCGTLGCFADWKVGYGPSLQLMDQV